MRTSQPVYRVPVAFASFSFSSETFCEHASVASNSLSLSQVARPRARRAVRALGRTLGPHGRRAGQDSRGHLIERITGERAHLRLFCKGLNVILADVGFARDRFNPGLDLLLHLCACAYASAPALRATRAPVPR